jgi:hypothetical protein
VERAKYRAEIPKPFVLRAFNWLQVAILLALFLHISSLLGVCPRILVDGVNGVSVTTLAEKELGGTEQLARFFPDVRPIGLPALLTLSRNGSLSVREAVVVEFAGTERAIFNSSLPLEFEDRVHLENERGHGIDAKVVAVQYGDEKIAVAVQILDGPFSWMKRP